MQVTTAQLAAHYARLFTQAELQSRLATALASRQLQVEHLRKVGTGKLGRATLAADDQEVSALRAALQLR